MSQTFAGWGALITVINMYFICHDDVAAFKLPKLRTKSKVIFGCPTDYKIFS